MALSLRTEKAIKKAMGPEISHGFVLLKKNGNHAIEFHDLSGNPVARFTLRQIVTKRYPAKKTKKATK